jgi:3',5'-cyclic AMP phosphodiesterase CpdA
MRIAHFSDLHLLSLEGVPASRFMNKRFTGWLNLRLKRGSIHRTEYVRAVAREIGRLDVDHVVVTGDLTNLALESEFELARDLFERDLGLDPSRITVVPGNHDLYTRGSLTSRRFEQFFGAWLQSDLPELAIDAGAGRFPVVKLRDAVAFVSVSSAVPRVPLVAAGELGPSQMQALRRVLAHPEVASRTLVLALHHPVVHSWSRLKVHVEGLRDATEIASELQSVSRGLVLHGHLHRRIQRPLKTAGGKLIQVGATSASLHHEDVDRMAGFNLYELGATGDARIEAWVYSAHTQTFHLESVPKLV